MRTSRVNTQAKGYARLGGQVFKEEIQNGKG